MRDIEEMFYFRVDLDYEYNVTLVQSKTYREIRDDIKREIDEKLAFLSKVTLVTNVLFLIFLFFTFIK